MKPHDAPARRLYIAAAGASGEGGGAHFEDDGVSWAFARGEALDLVFSLSWRDGEVVVRVAGRDGRPVPPIDWMIDGPAAQGRVRVA